MGRRWGDLDLNNSKLHIGRRVDAYGEEGSPKSAAGVRTIPISGQLTTALKKWRLRSLHKGADDLVFPNGVGNHTNHDDLVKREFLPLVEKVNAAGWAEVPQASAARRLNWHALRHFAISTWIEGGFTPKTVQTFAGHSSLQITMDRYGHLFPSDDHKRAMDQIASNLFA